MTANKKINLLITIFDLHFGGISNLILQTSPALKKHFNIDVIYFGPKDEMYSRYIEAGISTTQIPYNGLKDIFTVAKELAKFIKIREIEIVSTHLFLDKVIVTLAKVFAKFKVLSTLHSANDPYPSENIGLFINNKLEDIYQNYIPNRTIAVSQASLNSWIKFRNFNNKNTNILYSGIENLPCEGKMDDHLSSNNVTFVTACRFTKEKGLERLIRIFYELDKKNKNWRFLIIGDGFLRAELEDLVNELNLNEKFIFLGFQTELCKYYEGSHFYVNGSYHEALPVSILEAMSIGLPVIGSNVGGIPELITDNDDGFLVNFQNLEESVKVFNNCIEISDKIYLSLSENAINKFNSKFSIDIYVDNFYNEVLRIN